ncbi:MAG TPA: quinone oxidoreductase [Hyphomonas sp.]|nr:quinone oxidoreductase [Hyphomonas sp.]HRX74930.1 quinone oxidoreductase [Hyphomonas sp.]
MGDAYRIVMHETGSTDVLKTETFEPRPPGPGEALVKQTASGLNFIDTYFRTGLYPVKLPFVQGSEGAGTVEAVGEGVTDVKPGDRVAYLGNGTYATHFTGPAGRMVKLPDGISEEEGAAVLLKGLTAWMLLFEIRPVTDRDTVLIWAPVGGVGSVLTPWAASLGARVIAVTSSEEKAAKAKALGASDVIVGYDDVAKNVRALTDGAGVDLALDSVGKRSFEASLSSLKKRGWMVSYGNASGAADPMPPGRLAAGGSLILTRPTLFNYTDTPEDLARGARHLFAAMKSGTFSADIGHRFPLKEAGKAHEALESGKTSGAIVLVP